MRIPGMKKLLITIYQTIDLKLASIEWKIIY